MDPIFSLCGISTEVVVSRYFGEGREALLTRDLRGVDGIVVVGGDGTFGNIAQGLIRRTQADAGMVGLSELSENENSAAAAASVSASAATSTDVSTNASADVSAEASAQATATVSASADISAAASATRETSDSTSTQQKFFNLSSANFVSNSIPIGHIPGGSGNGFAATVAGNADPATAAILMALGKICYTDVTAVAQLEPSVVMVRENVDCRMTERAR